MKTKNSHSAQKNLLLLSLWAALILSFSSSAQAQITFISRDPGSIGLNAAPGLALSHGDLDNDGDPDILMAGEDLYLLRNIGTASAPMFTEPESLGLLEELGCYVEGMFLADVDGDGDLDLVMSGCGYLENVGTPEVFSFVQPDESPFASLGSIPFYMREPVLVDFDGDGDLDLFSARIADTGAVWLNYSQNSGSATDPDFQPFVTLPLPIVPLDWVEYYRDVSIAFADLDRDGDPDLLLCANWQHEFGTAPALFYLENTGSAGSPQFAGEYSGISGLGGNPFGGNYLYLLDMDGDGDADLLNTSDHYYFYGEYFFSYRENITPLTTPTVHAPVESKFKAVVSPNPASGTAWLRLELPAQVVGRLQLQLFDMNGRMVRQHRAQQSGEVQIPIPLNGLPAAYYILYLSYEGQTQALTVLVATTD